MQSPSTDTSKVDFAIITIRDDEFRAVLDLFKPDRQINGRRVYDICTLKRNDGLLYDVAILRPHEQGHGPAQAAASDVLIDLDPTWLLVVGIAGAGPDHEFSLGDVVLATRVIDFSVTAALDNGNREHAHRGGPMHKAVQHLAVRLPALESRLGCWNNDESLRLPRPPVEFSEEYFFGDEEWKSKVRVSLSHHFGSGAKRSSPKPLVTAHSIASGNMLVKDPAVLQDWMAQARDLKAVEMELPGIFEAARGSAGDRPVLAIRGISDIVGYKRNPLWTAYACKTAASLAHALLKSGLIPPSARLADPCTKGDLVSEPVARSVDAIGAGKTMSQDSFVVSWCLPRGYLILDDLVARGNDWSVCADYYDYEGAWRGGTHFHSSYDWDTSDALRMQNTKLHVEPGDHDFTEPPLRFLTDVRNGKIVLSREGAFAHKAGATFELPIQAMLLRPGEVNHPQPTPLLKLLGRLGELRDKGLEAQELVRTRAASAEDWMLDVERLRRTLRVAFARAFSNQDHPVRVNATEFLLMPLPIDSLQVIRWLKSAVSLITESLDAAMDTSLSA